MPVAEGHCEVPRGYPWPSATLKFYKFYFYLSFTLYLAPALPALPRPLPCPARQTDGQTDPALPPALPCPIWPPVFPNPGTCLLNPVFRIRLSGPVPNPVLESRFLNLVFRIWLSGPVSCRRIKTRNRRVTHGRTDYVNLYIWYEGVQKSSLIFNLDLEGVC